MNIPTAKQVTDLRPFVGETFNPLELLKWGILVFDEVVSLNLFKTSDGDEVVQWYTDEWCWTHIGGSSGDRREWFGNFKLLKRGKLAKGKYHAGFYSGYEAIITNSRYVKRPKMGFSGYSRGAFIAKIHGYEDKGSIGVVVGGGEPNKRKEFINFDCHMNKFDPVTKLVPTWKPNGRIHKYSFFRKSHTGYGVHL